ncbi:rho GDP-dissociation inhibitor 1-like [Acanthaster planci]|uniref:Rho GDP-dissociation inhibitor 3 n=1 Tax=Acanthaster planci TaxID=133434 RepID=A0A8B7YK59_ACAPL|nr:rho GDP-dissociation inhibitor 1-like [Acanthaster planci]XP_022093648.1 rho GDP-dissociation inhibitor 1-like [Acanthaster planci]
MADEPEAAPAGVEEVDDSEELTPGYKAPEKKSVAEIQELDADDESLVRYKKALLAGAEKVEDEGGPNVLVKALVFAPVGHERICLDLTGDTSKLKDSPFVIKEGTPYRIFIKFRVQREIVSGLRYFQTTHRKGIRVGKDNLMVGSYGPKTEVYEYGTPEDEAPAGMMARGHYTVKSKFTDDDKNIYLEWEWSFDIKKDWA